MKYSLVDVIILEGKCHIANSIPQLKRNGPSTFGDHMCQVPCAYSPHGTERVMVTKRPCAIEFYLGYKIGNIVFPEANNNTVETVYQGLTLILYKR